MSITLTYGATTIDLTDRLDWTDEFDWTPVEQATAYSITGALLVDVAVKQAGRPITLEGVETAAWITRATCTQLQAWAALPGAQFELTLRGVTRAVIFDHGQGGFNAQPLWVLADGEYTPELTYMPTFRFLEILEI
jgi:hypothetical protein